MLLQPLGFASMSEKEQMPYGHAERLRESRALIDACVITRAAVRQCIDTMRLAVITMQASTDIACAESRACLATAPGIYSGQ